MIPNLQSNCITAVESFRKNLQAYLQAHPADSAMRMRIILTGFAKAVAALHQWLPEDPSLWNELRYSLVRFAKAWPGAFGKENGSLDSGILAAVKVVNAYPGFFSCC